MSTLAHALSMSCRWETNRLCEMTDGHAGAPRPRRPRSAPPAPGPRYSSLGCPACLASSPTPPWPPSVRGGTPPRSIGGGGSSGARTAVTSPPSSSGRWWRRWTIRARRPRSLTLHYLRPPVEGPVRGHRHARASRARPDHGIGPPHPGRPRLHPGAGGAGGRPARPRAPRPPRSRGAVARRRAGRRQPRRRRARHPVPPSLRRASGPRHPALQRRTRRRRRAAGSERRTRSPSTTCCSPPSPTRGRRPSSRASRSPSGSPPIELTVHFRGEPARELGVVPRPLPDEGGGGRLPRGDRGGVVDGRPAAGREPPARRAPRAAASPSPRPRSRCP